jgi:hypothetical protein
MDTQKHFDGVLCPHSRETYDTINSCKNTFQTAVMCKRNTSHFRMPGKRLEKRRVSHAKSKIRFLRYMHFLKTN